jgi:UDP-N-acetylglucosamine transferase subunit ALG13
LIFVTLGSQKFPMDRLLIELDRLVETGQIKEKIFAQTGYCQYKPRHFESCPFLDKEDFDRHIRDSDLHITHAGSGAVMSGLKQRKRVITVPRLKAYGEHVDDHQLQLAGVLAEKGYLLMVEEMDMLAAAIELARVKQFEIYESSNARIIGLIRDFIEKS